MSEPGVSVIILAAGRGARFRAAGGVDHKLDALLAGQTVLSHVMRAVTDSGLAWHLVRPRENDTGDGMGDSIARGVRATAGAPGWLILPGDLPLVRPGSLARVAAALAHHIVIVPHYRGSHGHPVGFQRSCFDALAALSGDAGAAEVVRAARRSGDAHNLPLNDSGILRDVDTPEDLRRAAGVLRVRRSRAL